MSSEMYSVFTVDGQWRYRCGAFTSDAYATREEAMTAAKLHAAMALGLEARQRREEAGES